jgi:outer membrane protein assembly factor BamB
VKGQNKKVVIKGCKNGIVHVLDAATGELQHLLESPDIKRTPEQLLGNKEWNGRLLDPRNKELMTKKWTNYPSTDAFWMNCNVTGCLESDIAFDPTRNMVFAGTYNSPGWNRVTNADPRGVSLGGQLNALNRPFTPKINMTINAWDLDTGQLKWKYFIDEVGFRGGVMVSGGLVWFAATDGTAKALDADTGKVVYQQNLGISQLIQPTIAADADGKMKLFRVVGGHQFFANLLGPAGSGSPVPGAIMAYGLPDKIPTPQEIIKDLPKEQLKEVLKEVPKDVLAEVAPQEGISPISYGVIGIGLVLVVIAGVLFTRRKKV